MITDRSAWSAARSSRGLGDGHVAAPVRIADADVVALLRVGDRIDVYAATSVRPARPTAVLR